jgi:hypothetical protein
MKPGLLELFYQDEHTRASFRDFQEKVWEEMVIADIKKNGATNADALKEAWRLLDKSYARLADVFGQAEKSAVDDPR